MENIKDKIQKLLNLATSDNEHEAALALAKATELMNKWNLDRETVLGQKLERRDIQMSFYKWTDENVTLVSILSKLCDGFCLFGSGNKQQDRFAKILISGRPRDLENFRYLYDFINTKMWKESEKYKLKIRNSNQGKNNLEVKSFRIGFLRKIEEKLFKSKNDFFSVNKSLVSIDSETKRKEAKEFLMNSRENVKTVISTTRVVDIHLEAGKEIAESVDLNVAINGGKGISKIGYKK